MTSWFTKLLDSIPAELSKFIPESFTLKELVTGVENAVSKANTTKEAQKLLQAIEACLHQTNGDYEDSDSANPLALIISQLISPVVPSTKDDDTNLNAAFNENLTKSVSQQIQRSRALSILGIKALSALTTLTSAQLDPEVILTLISFADPSQEWTTAETAQLASDIITKQFTTHHKKEDFIPKHILQTYLRPLFSKSKPASVTSSGRKAAYPDQSQDDRGIPDDTSATKPWKFIDLRAIPIVSWAVTEANDSIIQSSWPLYIPVLLTLVDDNATPIRCRGLIILNSFLQQFPQKTLSDSGLAKVFEDAIFPTLTYLPSLTPVDESVQLLTPAYEALLTLASKFSPPSNHALLDRIFRQGILEGHFHAKEHLRIVQILNTQTVRIVNTMGIHAVKHLKDLIPSLIVTTLTDPFAPASPGILLSAIKTLQAVLTNCWPRIPNHQDEILNALVFCWLNVTSSSDANNQLQEVEKELITSSRLLSAVFSTKGTSSSSSSQVLPLSQLVSPLIQKEPSLARLFALSGSAEQPTSQILTPKQDSQHP